MAIVIDIANNPRVTWLLGQIEGLRRAEISEDDRTQQVQDLYVEVGEYVRWLLHQDPAAAKRIQAESRRWAEERNKEIGEAQVEAPEFDVMIEEVVYNDSVVLDEIPEIELTADSDIGVADLRSTHERQVGPLIAGADLDDPSNIVIAGPAAAVASPRRGKPHQTTPHQATSSRRPSVVQTLLRELGARDAAPTVVVKGIVAATTRLEERWGSLPDAAVEQLLILVGARAKRVTSAINRDEAADIKLALGRVRRFAGVHEMALPDVFDARTSHPPEHWRTVEDRAWSSFDDGDKK